MASVAAPHPVVAVVGEFVQREVRPAATALEHRDRYPHALVDRMRALGLFGALIPVEHGGLGLSVTDYARVIEALCRGWMSLAGVINSHTMAALIVLAHGTDEQRRRFLPRFARGEARGGLCLTEPHAGSDVQAIRMVARRRGDEYVLDGTKMFVTNGREGNTFALLARTDPAATPPYRGMSCFIVEKGHPGLRVAKSIAKLGYKGVDTAELVFEEFPVPAANLVGGVEGRGFKHVMGGLETGRINIAARAVGVAQAGLDAVLDHLGHRPHGDAVPPVVADIATRVQSARLVTYWAAAMKDRAERCDLEAGMAKLWASEGAHHVAAGALRVLGEEGRLFTGDVERLYRDTPLMIIGEGTNEIQRTIIARQLVDRYGERLGALTARDSEPEERRDLVLAVRQVVEKEIVPVAGELERSDRHPTAIVEALRDLGLFGAVVPVPHGGLGLDALTLAMLVEELARGSTTVASIVGHHAAVAAALARLDADDRRQRLLGAMARAESIGTVADGRFTARASDAGWRLDGRAALVDHGARAALFLVEARDEAGRLVHAVVPRETPGLAVGERVAALGAGGLEACSVTADAALVPRSALLAGDDRAGALARVAVAATALGLAQAAFEAALRYSQQRTAFGKPICHHQAVQLLLADMATGVTAARLLTYDAAGRRDPADGDAAAMAKVFATEIAGDVALAAMRVHGGYGYTKEFPVERYYRDAPRLALALGGNDAERAGLARRLAARSA
jgi:alkylation response protein AidB-like acyl-CoA dehydrogenase